MSTDSLAVVATAMREYGHAVRGDWGDVDGRCVEGVMETFADAISPLTIDPAITGESRERIEANRARYAAFTLQQWRDDLGICPSGEGHWTRHCQPTTTVDDGEDGSYTYGCGNEPTSRTATCVPPRRPRRSTWPSITSMTATGQDCAQARPAPERPARLT